MNEVKELREKQQKLVAEAREALNKITDSTDESRAAELETQHDRAMAEYDKLDARAAKLEKLNSAESNLDAPAEPAPEVESRNVEVGKPENKDEREVFMRYVRSGFDALDKEERNLIKEKRAQSTTNSEGGFTVPQGFEARIVESMKLAGPMLNPGVTDEITTDSGNTIDIPTADDTSNKGALISENTQVGTQDITFGQKQLEAYLYNSKVVRVSESLLQDSGVDLEGFLSNALGTRLGRIANEHLTTGTGTNQPNGIVTASTLGETSTAVDAVTFDEILNLVHSVDPMYRQLENVRFMLNDATLKALRKIKDGDGNYLWQAPNARTSEPATLWGFRYSINQDMPDLGTGNKPLLFGAFNKYMVRRVNGMPMKRLVERYADFGQVGFLSFARLDGELQDTAAVKHLINA